MVIKKLLVFVFFAGLTALKVTGQTVNPEDSIYSPFRQSRWFAGISGGILSSNSDQSQGEDVFTNRYNFDINISYFVARQTMAGLEFNIFRSAMRDLVERESESMTIGPIGRFYVSRKGEGSMFFETGFRYGKYWEKAALNSQSDSVKQFQQLSGKELGMLLGIGYSHTLLDKIAFEMGMDYYFAYFNGTNENTMTGAIEKADNHRIQFEFTVGFVVFLR